MAAAVAGGGATSRSVAMADGNRHDNGNSHDNGNRHDDGNSETRMNAEFHG